MGFGSHAPFLLQPLLLSDEQQFAVFGQWPEAVVNNELELVNLVADGIQMGLHGVVVSNGLVVLVLNLVGQLAGVDQLLYMKKLRRRGAFSKERKGLAYSKTEQKNRPPVRFQ